MNGQSGPLLQAGVENLRLLDEIQEEIVTIPA
jgi:hypothetical protein